MTNVLRVRTHANSLGARCAPSGRRRLEDIASAAGSGTEENARLRAGTSWKYALSKRAAGLPLRRPADATRAGDSGWIAVRMAWRSSMSATLREASTSTGGPRSGSAGSRPAPLEPRLHQHRTADAAAASAWSRLRRSKYDVRLAESGSATRDGPITPGTPSVPGVADKDGEAGIRRRPAAEPADLFGQRPEFVAGDSGSGRGPAGEVDDARDLGERLLLVPASELRREEAMRSVGCRQEGFD